ncbi:hypothetical protein JCM19240_1170 [Vibrio maritimus]|uniref:Uncharacterized protein n=1 Tax=Vibrio maritimus TaxID=990268 RepID=A0A090TT89_9VIBR|nr:hypothetical protein JCM19240_1170 [Vibrio maritimus]
MTQSLAQVYFDKGDIESAKFYSDHLLNKGVKKLAALSTKRADSR